MARLTTGPALLLLMSLTSFAEISPSNSEPLHFIQFSDAHSDLGAMVRLLRALNVLSVSAPTSPGHPTILLITGDLSGDSKYSMDVMDSGWCVYEMLAALQESGKYQVVFVIGNHEAFDQGGADGNRIFIEQIRFLKSKNVSVVVANAVTTPETKDLFVPYLDVPLPSNSEASKTLRIIGLTLEAFLSKTSYEPNLEPRSIVSITPSGPLLKDMVAQSLRDGTTATLVAAHENHETLAALVSPILDGPHNITLAVGGHGHDIIQETIKGVPFLESGYGFMFSRFDVDTSGRVTALRTYTYEDQDRLIASIPRPPFASSAQATHTLSVELEWAGKIQSLIDTHFRGDEIIGTVPFLDFNKDSLTAGRHPGGDVIANALVHWISEFLGRLFPGDFSRYPHVALWNSSSWRRDKFIAAGDLPRGDVRTIYPMRKSVRAFRVSGAELEAAILATLAFRLKNEKDTSRNYSPQLSSNLRVSSGHLWILMDEGWRRASEVEHVVVATDPFLGLNGPGLPELQSIVTQANLIAEELAENVLVKHFPKAAAAYSCEQAVLLTQKAI